MEAGKCELGGLGLRLAWRCRIISGENFPCTIYYSKSYIFPSTRVEKEKFEEIVCFPHSNIQLKLLK